MTKYYYKTKRAAGDAYHWHFLCSKVPIDVNSNPEWTVSSTKPSNREQCDECRAKDNEN